MDEYRRWGDLAVMDPDLAKELADMSEPQIEDAFYKDLSFGTGGLRGVIGAGTNRINVYTVAKASQGLSDYLVKRFGKNASVCIGFDSRIKSELFAKTAAAVFAANGVAVHLWPRLEPVPALSFSVRRLKASAGVMITASHNPSKYNGYKVYGADGCQITTRAAASILYQIEKLDIFSDVNFGNFDEAFASGAIDHVPEEVLTDYIGEIKRQSVLFGEDVPRDAAIVYSPLNGAGLEPVTRVLSEAGYANVTVVEEQRLPDGNFPTCPYPNPEVREAMELGIEYARRTGADLFLATDPDCDRIGAAVKDGEGGYRLLTGNETGILLLDYVCSQRTRAGYMPDDPVMIKTIVTTDLAERIAKDYDVSTINVLTGFKFIGEQIGFLESRGMVSRFVFGFEESYGYLTGPYVRDKDAACAAMLISEMYCYYASMGMTLPERLEELYEKYGFCLDTLFSYEFEGEAGVMKMQAIMDRLRRKAGPAEAGFEVADFAGKKIVKVFDYLRGIDGLPTSDVIKYMLEGDCSVVVRPSGTEPKLKVYLSVSAQDRDEASRTAEAIKARIEEFFR